MTGLYGLAVLCLGIGCCVAARIELLADARRRREEIRRLHDVGDQAGVVREACRSPQRGVVLTVLCVAGGICLAQGVAWMLEGWGP